MNDKLTQAYLCGKTKTVLVASNTNLGDKKRLKDSVNIVGLVAISHRPSHQSSHLLHLSSDGRQKRALSGTNLANHTDELALEEGVWREGGREGEREGGREGGRKGGRKGDGRREGGRGGGRGMEGGREGRASSTVHKQQEGLWFSSAVTKGHGSSILKPMQ